MPWEARCGFVCFRAYFSSYKLQCIETTHTEELSLGLANPMIEWPQTLTLKQQLCGPYLNLTYMTF